MACPSQTTTTVQPRSHLPIAASQAERFREIFRDLRTAPNASGGAIEHAEMHIRQPSGCEGLLAFPRPAMLGKTFPEALRRLWHICLAEYQVDGAQNQSAAPPDPGNFPESSMGFHNTGLGIVYGDFCVVPVQLGGAHRALSPMQAYRALEDAGQRPLFAYEALALLVGIPEIAKRIRDKTASLRFVERVRDSLNPLDHLFKRRDRSRVPEFAVLSGDGTRILLSGEPSPNKVPGPSGGMGLATRYPT